MKRGLALTLGFLFLLLPLALRAEKSKSKLDLTQQFLLLATRKTSTMQKELDEAAAAGYRVLCGAPTSGTEIALILESVATPPDTYEYLLLATSKTSTMQKELSVAASRGFRLLPLAMAAKQRMFGSPEIVVVLEKAPGTGGHYEYFLLATSKTSTMQKEMMEATEGGYQVVGMVSRDEHIVILERPAPVPDD